MTLQEIQARYPGCPHAIELHEDPQCMVLWLFERLLGGGIDETLRRFKNTAKSVMEDEGQNCAVARAFPEMDHPDFRRYVAAKLGMM